MKAFRIIAVLAALLIGSNSFGAQLEQKWAMNFKGAEIEAVAKYISELTGKNFIIDDRVRGTITVISASELTADEAYEVFQAILGVKGFTIVPAGKVLKIVAQADAKQSNIETQEGALDPGDRVVTRLVKLNNIQASSISPILDQFRSKFGAVAIYEPTNLLILTDSNSNIERLMGIIDAVDVETPGTDLQIFRLRYADATTVANTVTQAMSSSTSPRRRAAARPVPGQAVTATATDQTAIKVIPDTRMNAVIVIAETDVIEEAKDLINALDVELPSGKGKIHVLQLKYASAEAIAAVLNSITQSASPKAKTGQNPTQVRAAVTAPAAAPGAPAQKAEDLPVQFDESVSITADKATNALVIVALPQDFATLKSVIEKLDVLRPQVLVEALIIEMNYDKSLDLGVEWRTTSNASSGDRQVVGGTNFGGMSSLTGLATNPYSSTAGLFLAAIDGTLKIGDTTFPNIGALVSAMQTKGDVEILSTPNLLTTNNEEAEIVVSDNIPYKTSTVYDSNGNPRDNYEYRDVGLTLRFTPQINDDDYVKLKLYQESSSVVEKTTGTEIAPSTTKRTAKTTVLIKDGATVVIGGLIKDRATNSQSAVPCLGDLPILGTFFKKRGKGTEKTNLMIFLTPHVLRDNASLEKITEDKKDEHREFTRTVNKLKRQVTGLGELLDLGADENETVIKFPPKKEEATQPEGGSAK